MSLILINKYRSCISFTRTDNRLQLLQLLIIIQKIATSLFNIVVMPIKEIIKLNIVMIFFNITLILIGYKSYINFISVEIIINQSSPSGRLLFSSHIHTPTKVVF